MNPALPEGLITIGHSQFQYTPPSPHHADIIFERSHILHSFWKVHAVRLRVSNSVTDDRCQNLFWRVWGSYILSRTISTSSLIHLWQLCQKEPALSSIVSETACGADTTKADVENPSSSTAGIHEKKIERQTLPGVRSINGDNSVSIQRARVQDNHTRRRSTEAVEEIDNTIGSNGRRSSQTLRPRLHRTSSSNSRAVHGVSATKPRNRPSVSRKKSSQTAQASRPAKNSKSSLKSPDFVPFELENADSLLANTSAPNFQLPSPSSWEDEPTSSRDPTTGSINHASHSPELVIEPNFRNKFAERIASSSNLAGLNRLKKSGSIVRFADEIPQELRRAKRPDLPLSNENQHPSAMRHRESFTSVASVAVSDEDDMPSPGLPRTKSQLSMLIDETIARDGRKSFENLQKLARNNRGRGPQSKTSEENELLAMAHKDGVTKAGGKQLSRRFRLSAESESRYSSPSPPPIF